MKASKRPAGAIGTPAAGAMRIGIACDHGALYRTLHQLEASALIRSHWDADDLGPARRVYELTDAGRDALTAWSDALGGYRASLEKFFHLYHGLTGG